MLTHSSATSYFLARPRRFGKSLMCSTLCAYFEGKKELFEGLKISQWEKDWVKYPILYLDFVSDDYTERGTLQKTFINSISAFENEYNITANDDLSIAKRFEYDLEAIYNKTGLRTVIIVDEYDNPLINSTNLDTDKAIYRGFFSVLKSSDKFIRFAFMTGVTKFAKTSVFSGANQPYDLSLDENYSAICGITHKELMEIFKDDIQKFADKEEVSFDEMLAELIKWYDSYLFHERGTKVFNPVSLFSAFKAGDLQNYWFQTGTPTVLMKRIHNSNFDIRTLKRDVEYGKDELKDYKDDEFKTDLVPLLYYTGYLTIKEYDKKFRSYTLGFPNYEVELSFFLSLAKEFYGSARKPNGLDYTEFKEDFRHADIESVIERLKALFCTLPYANDNSTKLAERDFQNVIYLVFTILGEFIISEPHFSKGRADSILINDDYVYIFEFKVDKDAQTALNQIDLKNYAGRFKMDGKKIFKIGVNFSSTEKNITDWIAVEE